MSARVKTDRRPCCGRLTIYCVGLGRISALKQSYEGSMPACLISLAFKSISFLMIFWKTSEVEPSGVRPCALNDSLILGRRSEEHTSELQSLMRISYAVVCLKKKTKIE